MAVLSRHFFMVFSKNSFLIKDIIGIVGNVCERMIAGKRVRKFLPKTFLRWKNLLKGCITRRKKFCNLCRWRNWQMTICENIFFRLVETLTEEVLPVAKLD